MWGKSEECVWGKGGAHVVGKSWRGTKSKGKGKARVGGKREADVVQGKDTCETKARHVWGQGRSKGGTREGQYPSSEKNVFIVLHVSYDFLHLYLLEM